MLTLEEFRKLVKREIRRIPAMYMADIEAILVEEELCRSPDEPRQFVVLGRYYTNFQHQGPTIVLYYGSFLQVFPHLTRRMMAREIARTLAHELLHHWEMRSGVDNLGEQDRRQIARWRRRLGMPTDGPNLQDLKEATLFLYFLFLALSFLHEYLR